MILDGRYRLDTLLGRGGMGQVYRATHLGLERAVAVKLLDSRMVGDDDARRRFEREATSTGKLRHPNCVGVTDFGATPDGGRYLVMELVEGQSLDDLLGDVNRLPVGRAVHIMRHILRGLAHAHAQGLVHRDLKPANVMIAREGDDQDFARILDFGLARLISAGGGDRITRTGIVCGTPSYMSPEQVLDRAFDARTDLYAASVIFFEMITGHTPYSGDDTPALLKQHLEGEIPRLPDVPPALEDLIRRGLAKRPDDRPASAAAYLAELERVSPPVSGTIELTGSLASVMVPATRARPRWHYGAAIGAAVLVVGIIAAIAGHSGSTAAAAPVVAAAPAAAPDDPQIEIDDPPAAVADDVSAALALGGEAAVSKLRELQRKRPDDAQVAYALGRVYHRLGWPGPSLDSYRDALREDPSLASDAALIHDVVDLLSSKSTWPAAAAIVKTIGAPAHDALDACAAHDHDATVRARCAQLRDR